MEGERDRIVLRSTAFSDSLGIVNPHAVPAHQRFKTNDREDLEYRRKPSVKQDKKPAIGVREPGSAFRLAPQNNQLPPERCILGVQPALGLERRSQDGQHKRDRRDHAARMADSFAQSTRMRLSTHTGPNSFPQAPVDRPVDQSHLEPSIDTRDKINRLKTLKRAIYGRAGAELPRARMMSISALVEHEK
jgi:hypothetical protein